MELESFDAVCHNGRVKPFFSFYGGKWRAAPHYPRPFDPAHLVVEPFAGSAGYSVRHEAPYVLLIDRDPFIVGTWDFLIRAKRTEILKLPLLRGDQTTDDLRVPQEAKWLIGWWCNSGSSQPKKRLGSWARKISAGGEWKTKGQVYWNEMVRARIAEQVRHIRQWRVRQGTYRDAPDVRATWFVDPPYVEAGRYYRFREVDYADVASFVRSRGGLVIACEHEGAKWLPFKPLGAIAATYGKNRKGVSHEVAFVRRDEGAEDIDSP